MTVKEAHDIMRQLRELEFPFALRSSTRMTTLKTASVPTVAGLFVATGQRSEKNNTKRAADTEVIMNEIHDREAGSDAHVMAFARMNYIHSRYRKAGKILNEDMLHTLGSAVLDVFRSIEKYEWRQLSDVEKCAGITLSSLVAGSVAIRKFILRYLSLPRPDFMAVKVLDATPDPSTGRYVVKEWLDNPWYVKPTFLNRWGLKSWLVRLFGTGNVPTKNGPFRDEGYDIKAIGPQIIKNKGQAEVEAILENFRKRDIPAGCPFHA
ncbi:hypothetical protein APSETT444_003644 [Aspergillus pseudonomiae]